MKTYKLGNKGKCLIRARYAGQIGNEFILYDNQPYTTIDECQFEMSFSNVQENGDTVTTILRDSRSFVEQIRISNVLLTPKILNLIFHKIDSKLVSCWEKCTSDDKKTIFLNTNAETIYQVFIYKDGQLASAHGVLDIDEGLKVEEKNTDYLIVYSYIPEGNNTCSLNMQDNFYLSLDIKLIGNESDMTSDMFIHIDKCSLSTSKTLRFGNNLNTVDLIFTVINNKNDENYLIV